MKKVLVTGATGFIGQYFVDYLYSHQFHIRALVRSKQKANLLPSDIEIFYGDLTEADSLIGICKEIDSVFHLGGYAHACKDNNDYSFKQHHLVNYEGTKHILAEAVREKVKQFIYFSSVKSVADCEHVIDESFELAPLTPYGIAKRKSERLILETGHDHHIHTCILRPALIYGPGWKGNLAAMLSAIDKSRFLPLPETRNCRSMVSVEDVCQAALLAASNSNANKKIYFITDGVCYSTRQLYVSMCHALGKSVPTWHVPLVLFKALAQVGNSIEKLTGYQMPFNAEKMNKLFGSAQYNSNLIQCDLGFVPRYNLFSMLPKIIAAYKKMG